MNTTAVGRPKPEAGSLTNWFTGDRTCKILLITYGHDAEVGDQAAYSSLLDAKETNPDIELMVIPASMLSREEMQELHNRRFCVVINPHNTRYRGAAVMYNNNGESIGARGTPGCCGYDGLPMRTRISYQQPNEELVIFPNLGVIRTAQQLLANGGYFDIPAEIHVVRGPRPHRGADDLVTRLQAVFKNRVEVKLVDYIHTLTTNQVSDRDIVYLADTADEDYHNLCFEVLKDHAISELEKQKLDVSFEDFIQLVISKKLPEHCKALMRLYESGKFDQTLKVMGGHRRKQLQVIAAFTDLDKSVMGMAFDEPAHFGNNPPKAAKEPKGPQTMPGLGERKKKGHQMKKLNNRTKRG